MSDQVVEKKTPPQVSKQVAYNTAAQHFHEAFDVIVDVMKNSRNPSDRLGAAKTIINKILPDLKATELSGELAIELRNVLRLPAKRPLDTPTQTD